MLPSGCTALQPPQPAGHCGCRTLTWCQAPVLPLGCRAQPGVSGQQHAPAALLMPSSSSCALLLSLWNRKRCSCGRAPVPVCARSQAQRVGLISGAPRVQPGPKQSLQFSCLLGHLPGLLCGTQGELQLPVALGDGVSLSGFGEVQ